MISLLLPLFRPSIIWLNPAADLYMMSSLVTAEDLRLATFYLGNFLEFIMSLVLIILLYFVLNELSINSG